MSNRVLGIKKFASTYSQCSGETTGREFCPLLSAPADKDKKFPICGKFGTQIAFVNWAPNYPDGCTYDEDQKIVDFQEIYHEQK